MRGKGVSIAIISMLFALLLSVLISFKLFKTPRPPASNEEITPAQTSPPAVGTPEREKIKLYFISPTTGDLEMELRSIPKPKDRLSKLISIIEELMSGPRTGLMNPFPSGAKLRTAFIDGDGRAYLDFDSKWMAAVRSSADRELELLSSIISTVKANLPSIKEVQILIDGGSGAAVEGYIDISRPIPIDQFLKEVFGYGAEDDSGVGQPGGEIRQDKT